MLSVLNQPQSVPLASLAPAAMVIDGTNVVAMVIDGTGPAITVLRIRTCVDPVIVGTNPMATVTDDSVPFG